MPSAPPRACARCGRSTPARKPCQCRKPWEGSTHASSNDRQWQQVRDGYLREHPYCEWPAGCHRLADVVDHVTPLAEGGARYDPANLMSLCQDPHHKQKTVQDALRGKTRAR